MNKSIAGSGKIAEGTYEKISISGSGRLSGLVRCDNFHTSGSSKGNQIECKEALKVSGSCTFVGDVKAGSVSVSGTFDCGGALAVKGRIGVSGIAKCTGDIKCDMLQVSGQLNADSDIEAEKVEISGEVDCEGLLNAEDILIKGAGSSFGSIGGSKIVIRRGGVLKTMSSIPLISTIIKSVSGKISVSSGIEGDEIELENVHTPRVSGRIVTIGDDCKIDLVQYSEEVHISPNAKVAKSEKI